MVINGATDEPVLREVSCSHPGGLHRMAYWEWGDPGNPDVVVCVHGLTRNGRDFDVLAQRLSTRFRVVCPDIAGRGESEWLAEPALYSIPQYIADCVTLVARLDVPRVCWVGTSMGGLIGMLLAALPGNPVSRLVMNDIGPVVSRDGGSRIAGYVGVLPQFASFEAGERALRVLMADFGPHDDRQFRYLSRHFIVQRDGAWTFNYDPKIAIAYKEAAAKGPLPSLWTYWDAVRCPTLVLHGSRSDVLSDDTATQMTTRGPHAALVRVDGVGHAPTLIVEDQVASVERFLAASA